MVKWITGLLVMILFLGAGVHSSEANELTSDDIFPTDRVLDIQITVTEKNWNTIRFQSRNFVEALQSSRQFAPPEHPYTYVEASVSIDGVEFPKVGIRKKGFIGSQNHTRPSLKIKLNHVDKKGEIDGLTNLTFNNNQQDMMQISQFMGYALFNAIGTPAPRCSYAQVTVNGKNLGIYSHVESVRKPLLKRAFGNSKGILYEGTVVDFHKEWENSFEHKRGDDTRGREKILALIDVLADNQVTEESIGEHVDLDSFYTFWATESLLGFWDGYSGNNNNFFIYLNPETDKFHFLPWGADSLFSNFNMMRRQNNSRMPISVKTQGLIAYKLYQVEEGKERYAKTMTEILEKHWDEDLMIAEVNRIARMIQAHMIPQQLTFGDKEEWWSEKTSTYDEKLDDARNFIRSRKSAVLGEITGGMPEWNRRPNPPFVIGPEGFDAKSIKQFIELPEDNLWGAARIGDLDGIKQYLDADADINELSDETNLSPLSWATLMGEKDAAELLLELGANVNVRQEDGGTPLHIAVVLGRTEMAELLIEKGADVNIKNRGGEAPASGLHVPWAMTKFMIGMFDIELEQEKVEAGRAEIAKMLNVKLTAKPSGVANNVWEAVFIGDINVVKQAITDGTDVNAKNPQFGDPLLNTAALMGHTEILTFLLDKGADINLRNKDGNTALHLAAFLGRVDAVELLLKHGIDAKVRNNDGGSAMDSAKVDWGTTQMILSMIRIEIDEAKLKAGRAEVIKLLSPHLKITSESQDDIWTAAAEGDLIAIKKHLGNDVDVNAFDSQFGVSPLSWAAMSGQTEAAKLLIENGADVNAKNRDGTNPLHSAAFLGRIEIAKLLIDKGVDINARGNDGSLPMNSAQLDWGLTQLVLGFLQMQVDEAAVKEGRTKVVELLSSQNK